MKHVISLLLLTVIFFQEIKAQSTVTDFWKKFQAAYTKKDKAALTALIELPVRENLYPENPKLTLAQFLSEINTLGKYNLKKSVPKFYKGIKEAARFEGYKLSATAKYYELPLTRNLKDTFYSMALYIKADKGKFKLFAFDPETSAINTGD